MQETPAQSSASILYVEDDEDLAEEVAEALREHHRFVKAVGTGRDAQNALNSEHFDLIILDWQLPDVDGIEVLKDFRQRGGTTPILMLTGMKDI
ncbi:MAG TPA: response regulator, partial [Candidatus Obscuribacterales bacterium]